MSTILSNSIGLDETAVSTHVSTLAHHPLAKLSREDLDFTVQFVLCSGSLKDLAKSYGVSYPTIRTRLDQLIARVRDAVEGREPDPLAELLAGLVQRGELHAPAARRIIELNAELQSRAQNSAPHNAPHSAPHAPT